MKRVLFLTYFWPPSGKASLHWPLHVIRHLPNNGWNAEVLTVENESFTQKDESLLSLIPQNVEVHKTKTFEPFTLYKYFTGKSKDTQLVASETISLENTSLSHRISIWIRMNLFIPDARIGWYPFAKKVGKKILAERKFDAIVSLGPPHSTHLIARSLSKKSGIPFFPVLIDPWVDIAYYSNFRRSKVTLALDKHFESRVMEDSAGVVFITKTMAEDFIQKYPGLKNKYTVLYWGYNDEVFSQLNIPSEVRKKTILHAGNIFGYQNPVGLWKYLSRKKAEGTEYRLRFVGTVAPEIKDSIEQFGLGDSTEYVGFLPYSEVVAEMLSAGFLLVCATEKRHVPGKLFEYMRTGRPIIAFGDENTEVNELLQNSGTGMLFNYNEAPDRFFEEYKGSRIDNDFIKQFERSRISASLAAFIADNIKKNANID